MPPFSQKFSSPLPVEEPTLKETPSPQEIKKIQPSYQELLNAVPKECFEKSLPRSIAYFVWDCLCIAGMYYLEPFFESFGWPGLIFWYFLVGMFAFALFLIGHDCGHGTFSNYVWVNDLFGHLSHAPILVPYWPWQKSHRLHHTFTSHLHKDKGHAWITEETYNSWDWIHRAFNNNPLTVTVKWLIYSIGGIPDGSHFWPYSALFSNNLERIQCVVSGSACGICVYIAFVLCNYDPSTYLKFYILPVVAHGSWLTMVTYLQHQAEDINVYEEGTWTYIKGAAQTVDRPYGWGIDTLLHHITDGHVAHHLFFTKIPHYHLMKATKSLQKKLEPYGLYRHIPSRNFLFEYWRLNSSLEYLVGEGTGLLNYAKKSKKTD